MEHNGGLIRVPEDKLLEDIEDNNEHHERDQTGSNHRRGRSKGKLIA